MYPGPASPIGALARGQTRKPNGVAALSKGSHESSGLAHIPWRKTIAGFGVSWSLGA